MSSGALSTLHRSLLDRFQRDLPLSPRPFAVIAERLGCDEATVIALLRELRDSGLVSRVGPVFAPHRAGSSTLAAMAVPVERVEEVAAIVSGYDEVNHNYERDNCFNLWFVVAASDSDRVAAVLKEIARRTGLEVLDLPLEDAFHIDLGFPLQWT